MVGAPRASGVPSWITLIQRLGVSRNGSGCTNVRHHVGVLRREPAIEGGDSTFVVARQGGEVGVSDLPASDQASGVNRSVVEVIRPELMVRVIEKTVERVPRGRERRTA
jgi:hypothetical protein